MADPKSNVRQPQLVGGDKATSPLCVTVGHISSGPCPECGPCRYCNVFLQHDPTDHPFMHEGE
jgi:hypothetical protein